MFEQHPVPQQISSYQFRLVGDMTIKQFFQIAAGGIVALIIYGLPFPGFIKWPLIAIAALSGAAFAFLPIQDRPLEQWLFAFIRSIYSPTYFVWQKTDPALQYFKPSDGNVPPKTQPTLTQLQAQDLQSSQEAPKEEILPDFIAGANNDVQQTQQSLQPPVEQVQIDQNLPQEINQEMTIPTQEMVTVEEKTIPTQTATSQQVYSSQVSEVMPTQNETTNQPIQQAQFSPDAAPPLPPGQPNIIKGQVMDAAGHIIDGAILEIKDHGGRPVRALRSNKAGHFQIVTSLPNGIYKILIDKEGFEFDPIEITMKGELISPIAIRAKEKA